MMNFFFFSNACWSQLLAPLEIIMSKIYLKYISIHIKKIIQIIIAQQSDMSMKLASHDFLIHMIINMRNTKAKFPIIIHHKE